MPRELRLDYGGNSFRWFDTDEMMKVHGSSRLPGFLAQNIEQHFKVPVQFQVLCDLKGPLSSRDFRRVLSGDDSPRLWLFDSRYMGDDLRKQFERRQREAAESEAESPAAVTLSEPVAKGVTEQPRVSAASSPNAADALALGVAQLSQSLEQREQQVANLLNNHEREIQELQRELRASKPRRPGDLPAALPSRPSPWEEVKVPMVSDVEDVMSFFDAMEHQPDRLLRDMDSEDGDTSIQMLEAEEAMLLQSVQEALAKITADAPSTTWEAVRSRPSDQAGAPRLDLPSPSTTAACLQSDVSTMTCRGGPASNSGPLPPVPGLVDSTGFSPYAKTKDDERQLQQLQEELQEALSTARKAEDKERQSELHLSQWQARATTAEEALKSTEVSQMAQVKLQCQLEVEVALRNKDLEQSQELRRLTDEHYQEELQHQSERLQLLHRNELLTEQEEWQQMEILLLKSQQLQSERAQEQHVQDLMSSMEWERLSSELRVSQLGSRENRSKEKTKDLGARLVGRDLELCALETLMEAQRSALSAASAAASAAAPKEELQQAREEAKRLAAELAQKSEMLQKEQAGASMHLAEIAQQGAEILACNAREEELKQRVAQLEAQLEAARLAAQRPAVAPEPSPAAPEAVKVSDYISTADEELDKSLEKEIMELGPGVLKGHQLERTGPKRYKLGDQKVFIQLSEGRVTVRQGGSYVPLQQWTKELTKAGEKGPDDPFSALDAQSPFAAVR